MKKNNPFKDYVEYMDVFLKCSFEKDYIFNQRELFLIKKRIDERCKEIATETSDEKINEVIESLGGKEKKTSNRVRFVEYEEGDQKKGVAFIKSDVLSYKDDDDKTITLQDKTVQIDDVRLEEIRGMQYKPKYGLFSVREDCIEFLKGLEKSGESHLLESKEMIQEIINKNTDKVTKKGTKKDEKEGKTRLVVRDKANMTNLARGEFEDKYRDNFYKYFYEKLKNSPKLYESVRKELTLNIEEIFTPGGVSGGSAERKKTWDSNEVDRYYKTLLEFVSEVQNKEGGILIDFSRKKDEDGKVTTESGEYDRSMYDFTSVTIKKKGKKLVATLTTDNEGNAFSSMKNGASGSEISAKNIANFLSKPENRINWDSLTEEQKEKAKKLKDTWKKDFATFLIERMVQDGGKKLYGLPGYALHHNREYIEHMSNSDESSGWTDINSKSIKLDSVNSMNRKGNLNFVSQTSHKSVHSQDSETRLKQLSDQENSSLGINKEGGKVEPTVEMFYGEERIKSVVKIGDVNKLQSEPKGLSETFGTGEKRGLDFIKEKLSKTVGVIAKKGEECTSISNEDNLKTTENQDNFTNESIKFLEANNEENGSLSKDIFKFDSFEFNLSELNLSLKKLSTSRGTQKSWEDRNEKEKNKVKNDQKRLLNREYTNKIGKDFKGRVRAGDKFIDQQNMAIINNASIVQLTTEGGDSFFDVWMNGDPPPSRMGSDMRYTSSKEQKYTFNFSRVVFNSIKDDQKNDIGISRSRGRL